MYFCLFSYRVGIGYVLAISSITARLLLFTLIAFTLIVGVFCRARIFAEEKPVLREVWNLLIEVSRRGSCDKRYTNFLKAAASQIVSTLADDSVVFMHRFVYVVKEFLKY